MSKQELTTAEFPQLLVVVGLLHQSASNFL